MFDLNSESFGFFNSKVTFLGFTSRNQNFHLATSPSKGRIHSFGYPWLVSLVLALLFQFSLQSLAPAVFHLVWFGLFLALEFCVMNNLVSLNCSIVQKHKKENLDFLHFFGGRYWKTLSLNLLFDFLKSHKIYSAEREVIFYQLSMLYE